MAKKYLIHLDKKYIGYSFLESADAPMGVVLGKIYFEGIDSPYKFIKDYCKSNNIILNEDDPDDETIFTQSIDSISVCSESGVIIEGLGSTISGFKGEGYEIDIFGIPYPFYEEEFPHHRAAYENQFK